MSGKMKRTMVLLLIMLKEAGPTAACSSSCLSQCYCSSKGFSSVPQYLPTYITYLHLGNNVITTLRRSDFSRYSRLTGLNLDSNRISVINSGAFHNLASLTKLLLYHNHLTSLRADMFVGLDSLWLLSLHYNNILSIEAGTFNNTPQLRSLYLRYNNISTIKAGALANLSALRTLDLSHNNISTFPMEVVSDLNTSSRWSRLSINDNQMETLPPMAHDILAPISTVDISNNPWQCDCNMRLFARKMTSGPEFEKQIICAGPSTFEGKSLLQVVEDPIWDLIQVLICEETATSTGSYSSADGASPGASADGTSPSPGSIDGTSPSSFSLPLFLSSLGGVLVGAFLTSAVYSAAWCKIRRRKTTPNPVKYPRYRYASPRTAPSAELSLSVIDLNAEDTTVV